MLLAASTLRTTSWPGVPLGADPSGAPIDSNGNLASKTEGADTWGYEWNAQNELTRVLKNSVEHARFAYDPMGRRVEKVAGGVTTSYTYDGEDVFREIRGAATFKYVHGPGMDELLAREDGSGALMYYHADGLGSIVKHTSQAGAVVHEYRYDAWGNIELGASESGYAFTGREWDPEIGLAYYRARYYDPKVGRFTSEDPIGLQPGAESLFSYVKNHPVNFRDPLGLYRCVYYTAEHYLQCFPDDPWNPTYATPTASSGRNTTNCNDCQNNPDRSNVSNAGPPAEGFYEIAAPHFSRGKWRRNLTPDQGGRSAIQLHPCLNPASPNCSRGCIALTYPEFDRLNQMLMAEEGRNTMEVYGSGSFSGAPPASGRSRTSRR